MDLPRNANTAVAFDNLVLKRWLYHVGPQRRPEVLRKVKANLQRLGLTRREVHRGLLQLATKSYVHLDARPNDDYRSCNFRKRKHQEGIRNTPTSEEQSNRDSEQACELKRSSLYIDSTPKRVPRSGARSRRASVDSDTIRSPSPCVSPETSIHSDDYDRDGKESRATRALTTEIDSSDRCETWPTTPRRSIRSEGTEGAVGLDERCEDDLADVKKYLASRVEEVVETVGRSPTRVPELVDEWVGVRAPARFEVCRIKLNLSNIPTLRDRLLREVVEPDGIRKRSATVDDDDDALKKRRKVCAGDLVDVERNEARVRRKKAKLRELFGDSPTLSEEEHENSLLNTRKRRKKVSSDSCDSGLCQDDDVFFNETLVPVNRDPTVPNDEEDDDDETLNNAREFHDTVKLVREEEEKQSEGECKEDEIQGNEDGKRDVESEKKVNEDLDEGAKDVENLEDDSKDNEVFHEEAEETATNDEVVEDSATTVPDKAIKTISTDKGDQLKCNDNALDKPEKVSRTDLATTSIASPLNDAEPHFSNKSDKLEGNNFDDVDRISDETSINNDIESEHVEKFNDKPTTGKPMSSTLINASTTVTALTTRVEDGTNNSSDSQEENGERHRNSVVGDVSERVPEDGESSNTPAVELQNVADSTDPKATKDDKEAVTVEGTEAVVATGQKLDEDNARSTSPREDKPVIANGQESLKDSLLLAVKSYVEKHLADIVRSAFDANGAQQILSEKVAKEFIESLDVQATGCKEKTCNIQGNLADANRNVYKKSDDGISSDATREANEKLSSPTVREAESKAAVQFSIGEKDHLVNAAGGSTIQDTRTSEAKDTSNKRIEHETLSTEIDNSQKRNAESAGSSVDVENYRKENPVPSWTSEETIDSRSSVPVVPSADLQNAGAARSFPTSQNLVDRNAEPTDPATARLRVRTGAELGARWCPTPVISNATLNAGGTLTSSAPVIAPTSSSVPSLSSSSSAAPPVPPAASAPPPVDSYVRRMAVQEAYVIQYRLIHRIVAMRRNCEEQKRMNGHVPRVPGHLEYLLALQKQYCVNSNAMRQYIIGLMSLSKIREVEKLMEFVTHQFNYHRKGDRQLTVEELKGYLETTNFVADPRGGESQPRTSNCSEDISRSQPTDGAVPGVAASYVRVNMPLEAYINSQPTVSNARLVPNATQNTWPASGQQYSSPSYSAPVSSHTQQNSMYSHSGANQMRVPSQYPTNSSNTYETGTGIPNIGQNPSMPQKQRLPCITTQMTGQTLTHLIRNIIGTNPSQTSSSSENVPCISAAKARQQQPLIPNTSRNAPQMPTQPFQNIQSIHAQRRIIPGVVNSQLAGLSSDPYKNMTQAPQQIIGSPQILQSTTPHHNIQGLMNVPQNVSQQVPRTAMQGVPQVQPQVNQQFANPYQYSQQGLLGIAQNGQLGASISSQNTHQLLVASQNAPPPPQTASYSQRLPPFENSGLSPQQNPTSARNSMPIVTFPVRPVSTVPTENVRHAVNLAANVTALQTTNPSSKSKTLLRSLLSTDQNKTANLVGTNASVSRSATASDGEKLLEPDVSFTNWSSFTEIQKILLLDQLIFNRRYGLNCSQVLKKDRERLRMERKILKQFHKATLLQVSKLQNMEMNSQQATAQSVLPTQTTARNDNPGRQGSEEVLRNNESVEKNENKRSDARGSQSDARKVQESSESSERSSEQILSDTSTDREPKGLGESDLRDVNDEHEKLPEVPTNSPTKVSAEKSSGRAISEQPSPSLSIIDDAVFEVSEMAARLSPSKNSSQEKEVTGTSNVEEQIGNVLPIVGRNSTEEEMETLTEKSSTSSVGKQAKNVARIETTADEEKEETLSVSATQDIAGSALEASSVDREGGITSSTPNACRESPSIDETSSEHLKAADVVDAIETEKHSALESDVTDSSDKADRTHAVDSEEDFPPFLPVMEDSEESDDEPIIIEENLASEPIDGGDFQLTLPHIADVRSIEPEAFELIDVAEESIAIVDGKAIHADANENLIFPDANDNVVLAKDEVIPAYDDAILANTGGNVVLASSVEKATEYAFANNRDVLCMRCKRTRSTVACIICQEAHYCSKRCQELHWKAEHHKSCRQSTEKVIGTEK